jgi:hypothetical protein
VRPTLGPMRLEVIPAAGREKLTLSRGLLPLQQDPDRPGQGQVAVGAFCPQRRAGTALSRMPGSRSRLANDRGPLPLMQQSALVDSHGLDRLQGLRAGLRAFDIALLGACRTDPSRSGDVGPCEGPRSWGGAAVVPAAEAASARPAPRERVKARSKSTLRLAFSCDEWTWPPTPPTASRARRPPAVPTRRCARFSSR